MAIYSTLVTKAVASKLYPNLDLDNSKGKSSSTYNIASKLNNIKGHVSSALALYTKV